MKKRALEELNVMDDFLFNEIITDKQYGKEFVEYFLKTVLEQEVEVKAITAQMIGTAGKPELRAIRMDVVVEGMIQKEIFGESTLQKELTTLKNEEKISGQQTITDIEMQVQKKGTGKDEKFDLRRRSRLYQGILDVNMLESGQHFGSLPNVLIIICAPFDIFGEDRVKYTFENMCRENPHLQLKDGAVKIFLYTKGKIGTTEKLREMLHYIEDTREMNAINQDLKNIHKIVTEVKGTKERREKYMLTFEREEMFKYECREEGREEGEERVNRLIQFLMEQSRMDEVTRAVSDREYQRKLFQEFGI